MIFDPIIEALEPLVDYVWYPILDFAEEHRFKQKMFGLIVIGCGVLSGAIDVEPGVHDITFTVVLVPAGLWMIFSKMELFDSQ